MQYYTGIGGFSLLNRISASYQGFFFMSFKPWDERTSHELQAQTILAKINGGLRRRYRKRWLLLLCRRRFPVSVVPVVFRCGYRIAVADRLSFSIRTCRRFSRPRANVRSLRA